MKLSAFIAVALLPAAIAMADDLKVEALVIELPNPMADALASQGRRGDMEVWEKVVSPDGESLDKEKVKVIARFEVEQLDGGRGQQAITHDEEAGGISTKYGYRVEAQKPQESLRSISINTYKGKSYLRIWSFSLSAPLSAEWNFSARHRTKDISRIVLEKSAGLAALEEGGAKWTGARLLERDGPIGKRETKIDPAAFADDPNEFYRVEWRHRKGDVLLSHQDNPRKTGGNSVIEVRDDSRTFALGERTHLNRRSGALSGSISTEKDGDGKGSKVKIIATEYDRSGMEADPLPVAFQRATEQRETVWKGNLGEGKKQSSKIHVQIIAE
ncbi:MAG: hypothetical protein EOP83_19000 [Verrucomicrobiaceae bacterium]|nr:MAG: hypothetical protein EOP83_19000 [Verrucomicrobiaceae bacterium]